MLRNLYCGSTYNMFKELRDYREKMERENPKHQEQPSAFDMMTDEEFLEYGGDTIKGIPMHGVPMIGSYQQQPIICNITINIVVPKEEDNKKNCPVSFE